jgi:hypothetical protein
MTYRAKMQDGKVVFEGGIKPADGVELRVDIVDSAAEPALPSPDGTTLGQRLMQFSGIVKDLPPDAALNHDHYLYGTPKR